MTDWDGTAYRRVNSLQQWLAERAYAQFDGIQAGISQTLLDIGCGDGRITAELAARMPEGSAVGIDPSPRMIAIAPTSNRVSFQVGDVLSMTFRDAFDIVVSFNALHWVADQRAALSRIADALHRPGRALLVLVCGGGTRPSLERVAMQVTAEDWWRPHFADFDAPYVHPAPAAFASVAGSCGFTVRSLDVDDLSWDFRSAEAFTRWASVGFGAWTQRLSDQLAAVFVADVIAAYAQATGSDRVFRFRQLRADLSVGR